MWCVYVHGVSVSVLHAASYIGEDGVAEIAGALKANAALKSLFLGGAVSGAVGHVVVAREVNAASTRAGNRVGDAGGRALLLALRSNKTLTELDCDGAWRRVRAFAQDISCGDRRRRE